MNIVCLGMDLPSEKFLGKNVRRDKTSDLFSEKKKKSKFLFKTKQTTKKVKQFAGVFFMVSHIF